MMTTERGPLPTFYSFLEEIENSLQDDPIVAAIKGNNLDDLKTKWSEQDRFYRHKESGLHYLHTAVLQGDLDIVTYLVNAGVDVNDTAYSKDNRYRNLSCLHLAVGFQRKQLLTYLKNVGCVLDDHLITGTSNGKEPYAILNGMSPFHFAVLLNDFPVINQMLEWRVPINAQTNQGLTPVHLASILNYEHVAQNLLKHKIIKDVTTSTFATPVFLAAQHNSHKVLNLLLKTGHNPKVALPSGYTVIHAAVENGSVDSLVLLIKAGCDIESLADAKNSHLECCPLGVTPVTLAAAAGKRYAVEILLKQGADPNVPCSYISKEDNDITVSNVTALHFAVMQNSEILCKTLLKFGADVNAQTSVRESPLIVSIQEGFMNVAKLLLENKADININNGAPLFTAIRKKNLKFCDVLLEQPGIHLNLRNTLKENDVKYYDVTPLHLAVMYGLKDLAVKLIDGGADVEIKMSLKENVPSIGLLHTVALSPTANMDLAQTLLDAGCPIDEQTVEGCTPLLAAVTVNHVELVKLFLSTGADANLTDKDGFTPLLRAMNGSIEAKMEEMVELLVKSGCNLDKVLNAKHGGFAAIHFTVLKRNLKVAKILIDAGCDVNLMTSAPYKGVKVTKASPLVIAIQNMNGKVLEEIVRELLKHGADPMQLYDSNGLEVLEFYDEDMDGLLKLTALHAAVVHNRRNIVRILIDHGADINACSPTGYPMSPLSVALRQKNLTVAELLIRKGADVNPAREHHDPGLDTYLFHNAANSGLVEILDLVADFGADLFGVAHLHEEVFSDEEEDEHRDKRPLEMTALSLACECNEADGLVQKVVTIGADVNACTSRDLPPVGSAVDVLSESRGDSAVRTLVQHGADLSLRYNNNTPFKAWTPLTTAASSHMMDSVRYLLQAGADILQTAYDEDFEAEVPAAFFSLEDFLDEKSDMTLFNHGTNINFSASRGFNILHYAVCNLDEETVVKDVLKYGADPSQIATIHTEGTPVTMAPIHLLVARGFGSHEIAKLLISSIGDINSSCLLDYEKFSLLMTAVMETDDELARTLIRYGADVNFQSTTGETALYIAIDALDDYCFQVLLDSGCDVNIPTNFGMTPVIQATTMGEVEMVRALIGAHCNVNASGASRSPDDRDDDGMDEEPCQDTTALHQAAELGHPKITKLLLEAGANTEARETHNGSPGYSPLHCATVNGHEHIVNILVGAKCNINAQTEDGFTALHLAVKKDNKEMAKLLNKLGANPMIKTKTGQLASAMAQDMHFMQELLNYELKWTFLHNRPSLQRKRLSLHQRLSMQNLGLFGLNAARGERRLEEVV